MISSSTAAATAQDVARGVSRLLLEEGYSPILEFTLPNGRRLDVAAIGPGGEMLGVEIKVALADLQAATRNGRNIWTIATCSISPFRRISRPNMCRRKPA